MKKSVRDKVYEQLPLLRGRELQQTLQHLDNERHLLHSIFNLLQEAILLVDTKGYIGFYNESALQLLKLPRESKNITPLWHWLPALKKFFTEGAQITLPEVLSKEIELIYPDKRWVRLYMQSFPEKNREQKRFIVIIHDITQEREDTEEWLLQERFDSVVQLASEVAHELGNPLNSMGIHLQLIQRTLQSAQLSQTVSDSLQVCQKEVQRLDEIIQQFLKAIRPRDVHLKRDSIIPTIQAVLSVLKPQLKNLKISTEFIIPQHLSTIFIDKARLHQAVFNVLKNAIEAIGSDGWIRISCMQNDCYLIIAFADSGCGISGEQAVHMLSCANRSKKQKGHGIGMLIVQRVMREHNGCVEIESKTNVGSILYLKFPLPEQSLRKLGTEKI